MMPDVIVGSAPILLLCDHASNAVPPDIDLGIPAEVLDRHVGFDIGAGALTRSLAHSLDASAILGTVSRLVIDLHRAPDHPGLIPTVSDGHAIPGNIGADRAGRIARFYRPYHRSIAEQVRALRPALIVAVHSFTPRLEEGNQPDRRWQIGILSNRDRRAAELAIPWLKDRGVIAGDNQPYSGRQLNVTLNRHAEAAGIPSLSIEVRNDLIQSGEGVATWNDHLTAMLLGVRNSLARGSDFAT